MGAGGKKTDMSSRVIAKDERSTELLSCHRCGDSMEGHRFLGHRSIETFRLETDVAKAF